MNTKVSVVIPIFNAQKNLELCLASVLAQDFSDFEVICVDNHSTDQTKTIIERWMKKDQRLRYVFEPFRSRGAARNAGIKAATGEIICMVDSDCVVPDHWIRSLIKPILEEKEEIVMGWEETLEETYCAHQIQMANRRFIEANLKGPYIDFVDTKNIAVVKDVFSKFPFDPSMVHMDDYEWALRLRPIKKIRFLADVKVKHLHKTTLREWMRLNFNRACWAKKIYRKYQGQMDFKNDQLFNSFSVKNFLIAPLWVTFQFFKRPWGEAWFILASELSWRAGILFA